MAKQANGFGNSKGPSEYKALLPLLQQPAECLFSQYVLYYTCPTIVIIIFECVLGVNHHAKYFIYIVSFNPHHSLGRQVLLSELYR